MLAQLGRFGIVGILATILHLLAAYLANQIFELPPQLANFIGFLVAFFFSFIGHLRFTFSASGATSFYFPRFIGLSCMTLLLSSLIVYVTDEHLNWPFLASIVAVGFAVPLISFVVSKYWVFNAQQSNDPQLPYVFLAISLQILAYFYWQNLGTINHDTAWYLVATQKWLSGEQLYTDILEVNPPWSFYLTVPSITLANLTAISPQSAFFAFLSVLTISSLLWVWRLLRTGGQMSAAITTQLILLVICFVTFNQPGQREHLFILFFLPYLIATHRQISGDTLTTRHRVFLTLFALAGVMIKPHFALIPFFMSLTSACLQRSIRPIFQFENWILLIGCLGYVAYVRLVHPEFFTELLPISLAVYGEFGFEAARLLIRIPALCIFALAFCCLVVFRAKDQSPSYLVIATAAFASAVAFYLQATGFRYQTYPFYTFALVFCAVAIVSQSKRQPIVVAFATAILLLFASPPPRHYSTAYGNEVTAHLANLPPNSSALLLSTNVSAGFPTMLLKNHNWSSRFPAQWFIPGAINKLNKTNCSLHKETCTYLNTILDLNRKYNTEDLIKSSADIIIVDIRKNKSYIKDPTFDYIEFMKNDPKFVEEFKKFAPSNTTLRFQSWKRIVQ